jgi:putative hydrolase of the HAD superfamily
LHHAKADTHEYFSLQKPVTPHPIMKPHPTHPIKAILFDLDETLWPLVAVLQQAEATLYAWLEVHLPDVARRFSQAQLAALRTSLIPTDPRFRYDLWALRHATLHHACVLSRPLSKQLSRQSSRPPSDAQGKEEDDAYALLVEQAMAVFSEARNKVTPFDDVIPALARLQDDFMIGSISNGFADLQAIGIAHHFKISLAAHQFGCAKPDPRIFHAACDALEIAPHEALYVGDDPVLDVQGAQDAGLHAVWMDRFQRELPSHIAPSARVANLHELHDWLQQPIK